jgi:hypothetical protein
MNTQYRCDKVTAHAGHVNPPATVRLLSFNSRRARMSSPQVQRVFTVEHCLASRSCLTCQYEFSDTYPDPTVSLLVNRFRRCKHF